MNGVVLECRWCSPEQWIAEWPSWEFFNYRDVMLATLHLETSLSLTGFLVVTRQLCSILCLYELVKSRSTSLITH